MFLETQKFLVIYILFYIAYVVCPKSSHKTENNKVTSSLFLI